MAMISLVLGQPTTRHGWGRAMGLSDVYPLAELEPRTVATEGSSPRVTIGHRVGG